MVHCCPGCLSRPSILFTPSGPSCSTLGHSPSRSLPHLPPTPTPGPDALNWISTTPGPPLHPTQAPVPHRRPPFPRLHPARSAWPLTSWARHPPLWVLFTLLSCRILPGTMSPWECSVFCTTYKVASRGCLLTPLECWQPPPTCLPVWVLISPRSYCKIYLWAPAALLCWGGHPPC